MKIAIVSYSFTGNNEALAASLASACTAKHIRIVESKRRTKTTIYLDLWLKRKPPVNPITDKIEEYDLVIFVGPVWVGQVATPFRTWFGQLKGRLAQYAFVSISGGADGPNPNLAEELKKRLGKIPAALIDLHIADLLPATPKPTRQDTASYRLNAGEIKILTNKIIQTFRTTVTNFTV